MDIIQPDWYILRYKPSLVVSDKGEVWVLNMFQNRFVSDSDVTTHHGYFRLEGLPIIVKAHIGHDNRHTDIIMLTEHRDLMIVNREHPHGYIVESAPIKELSVSDHIFVLDIDSNLHYLGDDNKLSDQHIPNVKLYTQVLVDPLVVVDNNNVLYSFPRGNMNTEPTVKQLEFEVKWLLHQHIYTFVIDYDHNLWEVNSISRPRVTQVASLSSDIVYVMMTSQEYIYAIDIYGNLLRYNTMEDDTVQISGTYTGFYHNIGYNYLIIGENYTLYISSPDIKLIDLPIRLFNFEEYSMISRRPRIKSARFTTSE